MYGKWSDSKLKEERNKIKQIYGDTALEEIYNVFMDNLKELEKIFPGQWIKISEIQIAKQSIWSWDSDHEREIAMEEIERYGFYFPVVVLERGYVHAQEDDHIPQDKYYVLDGNHRIATCQELIAAGRMEDKEILVYIVPGYMTDVRKKLKNEGDKYRTDEYKIPRSHCQVMPYKKDILYLGSTATYIEGNDKFTYMDTDNVLEFFNGVMSVMHNLTCMVYGLYERERYMFYNTKTNMEAINKFDSWLRFFHPEQITVAEVAGKDSIAAIIKAFEDPTIKYVLPISIRTRYEYGIGPDTSELQKLIEKKYNKDKRLMNQINIDINNYDNEDESVTKINCIQCHHILHMERAKFAEKYDRRIITGERIWHGDMQKDNQKEEILLEYDKEFSKMNIIFIRPIAQVKEDYEILSILNGMTCNQYKCSKGEL